MKLQAMKTAAGTVKIKVDSLGTGTQCLLQHKLSTTTSTANTNAAIKSIKKRLLPSVVGIYKGSSIDACHLQYVCVRTLSAKLFLSGIIKI